MLHVGTKLGIVYGISMLVSLILLQRTTCCQFLHLEEQLGGKKSERGQEGKKGVQKRTTKLGKSEEGKEERGHTAHKSLRGSKRCKTIDLIPNAISELDP
jgi:hypothetical protein